MERAHVSFTFDKCLGRGGYGEVYLATRTRPGGLTQRVAVKVLRSTDRVRESQALLRLRDEGRVLAMLDHPAILGVLEMTRIDGRVALVTEYVEGVDVARCCKKGSLLPARAVAGIVGEVAAALHTAANTPSPETGKPLALIHRDIKPENIRLSKHGEVKLLDFGIARSTEMDREAETVAGTLPFTPGYAAPECFNDGVQSAASDIFALGATAYRMLVGDRLFAGIDTSSQLALVVSRERYDRFLVKRLAEIPEASGFRSLVEAMLSFDPAARPTAVQVQRRCEVLSDTLDGPTHVRWARATAFGEPQGLPDAELTGRTIRSDDTVDMDQVKTQRHKALPQAAGAPPVPTGLASIKPDTAPFTRPTRGSGSHAVSIDGLPVPAHGLATLPSGALVGDVPSSQAETVVLDKRGGVGLFVKLAAVLVLLVGVAGLLLVVVGGILFFFVG